MNVTEAKERSVPREDLLYNQSFIRELFEEYGDASEIKRHVKTSAKVYEIRTAIYFWRESHDSCFRTSDAMWSKLELFVNSEMTPNEVEAL